MGGTGGFIEPNERPADTAVRETAEETGLVVEPRHLVGVYPRPAGGHGPHGFVGHVFLCPVDGGSMATSGESETVAYRAIDAVSDWHTDHRESNTDAHELWAARSASGSRSGSG